MGFDAIRTGPSPQLVLATLASLTLTFASPLNSHRSLSTSRAVKPVVNMGVWLVMIGGSGCGWVGWVGGCSGGVGEGGGESDLLRTRTRPGWYAKILQ